MPATTDPTAPASRRRLTRADHARAWLVTGPVGRGAAFCIDFLAALRRGLLGR